MLIKVYFPLHNCQKNYYWNCLFGKTVLTLVLNDSNLKVSYSKVTNLILEAVWQSIVIVTM